MAYDEADARELERQLDDLKQLGWTDFDTQRTKEHNVIRRKARVAVDSVLAKWEDGIDPQSALLLYDRSQHMQILTMEQSKVDVMALDGDTKDCLKAAEKKRMYLASLLAQMNDNNAIDDSWAQGISDTGLTVFRLLFKMPPEMPEKEVERRMGKMRDDENAKRKESDPEAEDESDDEYEAKKDDRTTAAREEYEKEYEERIFWTQAIGLGQYGYTPLNDNPDLFIQKSVVPYIPNGIENLYGDDKGKTLTLDENNGLGWTADPRSDTEDDQPTGKTLTHFVRDAQMDGYREITEYICHGEDYGKAEVINQYRSPLKSRCSFFPVASGGEVPNEPTPIEHYPSKMQAEIASIGEINYLKKHITILARRASMRGPFINGSKVPDTLVPYLQEMGFSQGAQGAQRGWVMAVNEPSENELPFMPGGLERWPDEVDEHLAMLIAWCREDLANVRPNRLLIGDYVSAQEPNTATTSMQGAQAAALPYGKDHAKECAFKRQLLDAIGEIIISWDDDTPSGEQKKYYMVGTGSEPVLTGTIEPGATEYVTADDFRRKHFIKVENKNMTLQEQLMNNQESRTKYDRGELTWFDHLRNEGQDDPISYDKQLRRDRIERGRQGREDALTQQEIEEYMSILSGRDIASMSGGPVPPTLDQGGQQQNPPQKFGVMSGVAPVIPGATGSS